MESHGGGGGHQSSANIAAKGRGSNNNFNNTTRGGHGGGCGTGRGRGRHTGAHPQGGGSSGVTYQLCDKDRHTIVRCFKRFNTSFTEPPPKTASLATTSYGEDTNWYMDTGATDHITSELEKLNHFETEMQL